MNSVILIVYVNLGNVQGGFCGCPLEFACSTYCKLRVPNASGGYCQGPFNLGCQCKLNNGQETAVTDKC
ncbi:unnamed protein product [Adineta steineri]|uniref:Uncharacterized protein n=2 Tax=Adineta steineri TaxID=433720 RepID=A0A814QVL5_9BILA|nr:unnamed protein product [Adineta steineri]